MPELYYTITAEAPLAINERKPGGSQYQEGLTYIPGRVVRGAFADLVLATCRDPLGKQGHHACPQPALCQALFGEQMLFRDARPTHVSGRPPRLLPTTALSCKDNKGFTPKGHGVFDTLIDRACYELGQPAVFQYLPSCPCCGGRTTGYGGVYTSQAPASGPDVAADQHAAKMVYYTHSVAKELLTRVAINRRRGVAEDELLYAISALSQHVLDPTQRPEDTPKAERLHPATYAGAIWLPDAAMTTAVEAHLPSIHQIGSGGSRGLGRVQMAKLAAAASPTVAERFNAFNAVLQRRATVLSTPLVNAQQPLTYFAVTLQSDAILQEDWSPTMQLTPPLLWAACGATGAPPADLTLVRSYTTPTTRGGWNAIWGLRKETAQSVQAGAVYLFAVSDPTGWLPRLVELETQGVGQRRAEGFGQVRICDEFHYTAVGSEL